jgi:hypothetical protein
MRSPESLHLCCSGCQVDANLAAADIPLDLFDAIVSADAFEHLKPSPGAFMGRPAAATAKAGWIFQQERCFTWNCLTPFTPLPQTYSWRLQEN